MKCSSEDSQDGSEVRKALFCTFEGVSKSLLQAGQSIQAPQADVTLSLTLPRLRALRNIVFPSPALSMMKRSWRLHVHVSDLQHNIDAC